MSTKFTIQSNIDQVKKDIVEKVKISEVEKDKILREVALDIVAMISDRVQQLGLNTAGEKMYTKNGQKHTGDYTYYYGKKREKSGRQIEHIDLTFEGNMFNDFIIEPEGEDSYIVGFRGQDSSDKADWNERKFGTIFELSSKEEELINDIIKEKINAALNR